MSLKQLMLWSFFIIFGNAAGQTIYYTQPLANEIKTIQIGLNDDAFAPPIIQLNSNDAVTLKFDKLSIDEPRLRYRLIHCDAGWQKDNLSEIEYLNGFNDQLIENYRFSENTTVPYIHYSVSFPNAQMKPKISGNYAVEVYYESYPDEPLLQACFSVVEPKVSIRAQVAGNTDIDINKAHQQLSFEINHASLSLRDPMTEIIVNVRQNNRKDNERLGVKPTFVNPGRLIFEHNANLIFESGNEYRRFETLSSRFGGMGVDKVYYKKPYFDVVLQNGETRARKTYQYDQDQNGRFFVKNSDGYDSDIDADYFQVYFISSPQADNGKIYLNGDFTYNNSIDFELRFDAASGVYQLPVLLKQGSYNYQYVTQSDKGFSTGKTEGNYYETRNEYLIMVYHRAPGGRYDKLVGWQQIGATTG